MASVTKVLLVDDEHAIADANHVWHGDIADNEVGFHALCDLDRFGAGIDGRSIEASLVENDRQRIAKSIDWLKGCLNINIHSVSMAKCHQRRLLTLFAVGMFFVQAGMLFAVPPETAHKLIEEVVYNELQDRANQSFWRYSIQKPIGQQSITEEQVETRYGSIYRVIANNGVPLDQTEQEQEDARLNSLLRNPGRQQKANQQHEQDEQQLERLLALLPDAFLCDYAGQDGGDIRLNFRPNPSFKPPTHEARIFHGLAGQMWIDPQYKRLVALKGKLIERVEFGYGLLGHINEGGTFAIHRQRVSPTEWKTDLIDIHVSGRVLLFKTVNKEQHEVRSGFRAVPETLTLEQAQALLKESTVTSQLEHGQSF